MWHHLQHYLLHRRKRQTKKQKNLKASENDKLLFERATKFYLLTCNFLQNKTLVGNNDTSGLVIKDFISLQFELPFYYPELFIPYS